LRPPPGLPVLPGFVPGPGIIVGLGVFAGLGAFFGSTFGAGVVEGLTGVPGSVAGLTPGRVEGLIPGTTPGTIVGFGFVVGVTGSVFGLGVTRG